MNATVVETQTRTCDFHGEYLTRQWSYGWSSCPKCAEETGAALHAEELERERIKRIDRLVGRSGIPARFHDAAFDDSLPAPLRAWAARLIAGQGVGPVVLVGGVGTGKTHAACATLAHVIRACSCTGQFTTPSEFGREIRDQWTERERTEGSILDQYAGAAVLVLDDVGAQRAIDAELLQELVRVRYDLDRLHATIITSNLAVENLATALGERAADRIREGSIVIPMTGASRRTPGP